MMSKLDFTQQILCRKIAKVFEYAAMSKHFDAKSFCEIWLSSDVCDWIFDMDETIICQSYLYLYNSLGINPDHIIMSNYDNVEDMYWLGFILTYWQYLYGVSGSYILAHYDIAKIVTEYDTLHTVSNKMAIDIMIEDDKL